jgi:hypothetical protein
MSLKMGNRRDGKDYDQFIDRVKGNSLAVKVKIADLKDNSDLRRNGMITDQSEPVPSG